MVASVRLLRSSLRILAEGVLDGLSVHCVAGAMRGMFHVAEVLDLHVYAVDLSDAALDADVCCQMLAG